MQNCADGTLLVRDIFNFLWNQGAHMFVWNRKQNFCIIPTCITCSKSTIKILEQGLKVSKLTRKTTEWCHWRHSRALFVIFKYILHLLLLFWLLTLSMQCWQELQKFTLLLSSNKIKTTGETVFCNGKYCVTIFY